MCVQKIQIPVGKIDFVVRVNRAKRIFPPSSPNLIMHFHLLVYSNIFANFLKLNLFFQVQSMDIAAFNKV